jgi:UDP-2,4-diacetamido-2,4,6-trideoxy-beta-L-altropyranose hydrolase
MIMVIDFVFRCDAGAAIGIGHVMRCLTLANQLGERGYQCAFLCADIPDNLALLIESKLHLVYQLQTDDLSDAEMTRTLIDKPHHKPVLIVDHYGLDKTWQMALYKSVKHLVVIDDLPERAHYCDMLIDQTWLRHDEEYLGLVPPHSQLCCGSEFALLRPQFAQLREASLARRKRKHEITNVLMNFGGGDPDGLTLQAISQLTGLAKANELRLTAIMGSASPYVDKVRDFIANSGHAKEIKLIVDCEDMATQFAGADIAIGSAGSTTWERACLGIPSIMVCEADNQKDIFAAFEREKLAKTLYPVPVKQLTGLAEQVEQLLESKQECQRLTQQSSKIVDGLGAERVVERLLSLEKHTA